MGPQDFSYHDITDTGDVTDADGIQRTAGSSEVAVCLPVEQSDLRFVPGLLAELARPCAIALDVVLCDLTLEGDLHEQFALFHNCAFTEPFTYSNDGARHQRP